MLVVVSSLERLSLNQQQDHVKITFTDLKRSYEGNYSEIVCFIYHPVIKKYLKYRKEGTLFMIKEPVLLPYKQGLLPAFKISRVSNLIPVSIAKDFAFC